MRTQALVMVGCLLLLGACNGVPLEKQTVSVQDDQYSQSVAIIGKRLFNNPSGGPFKEWFIRSFVRKSDGRVSHELYIYTHYLGEWHFYQSGADDRANQLRFVSIDQNLGGCQGICDFNETFVLALPDTMLQERAQTGFSVKVSARDGTAFILSIPAGQIQPQLTAVNVYRDSHKSVDSSVRDARPAGSDASSTLALGVTVVPTPPPLATMLKVTGGLLVISVSPDSPADRAGVKAGDVIRSYAGNSVSTIQELQAAIAATHAGSIVRALDQRGTAQMDLQVQF